MIYKVYFGLAFIKGVRKALLKKSRINHLIKAYLLYSVY